MGAELLKDFLFWEVAKLRRVGAAVDGVESGGWFGGDRGARKRGNC